MQKSKTEFELKTSMVGLYGSQTARVASSLPTRAVANPNLGARHLVELMPTSSN